jgi:hypothetical protein
VQQPRRAAGEIGAAGDVKPDQPLPLGGAAHRAGSLLAMPSADDIVLGENRMSEPPRPQGLEMSAAERAFIYLCMERWNMWDDLFGFYPRSIGELDYMITHYLYERYPGLVHESPVKELYLRAGMEVEGV